MGPMVLLRGVFVCGDSYVLHVRLGGFPVLQEAILQVSFLPSLLVVTFLVVGLVLLMSSAPFVSMLASSYLVLMIVSRPLVLWVVLGFIVLLCVSFVFLPRPLAWLRGRS